MIILTKKTTYDTAVTHDCDKLKKNITFLKKSNPNMVARIKKAIEDEPMLSALTMEIYFRITVCKSDLVTLSLDGSTESSSIGSHSKLSGLYTWFDDKFYKLPVSTTNLPHISKDILSSIIDNLSRDEESESDESERSDSDSEISESDKKYLYLEDRPLRDVNPLYVIALPPMIGSGDIYHIAAYMILAASHNHKLPKVWLMYDTGGQRSEARPSYGKVDTYVHVQRSKIFMGQLGLGENVTCVELPSQAFNPNARQDKMYQYLKNHSQPVYHIDQKLTTTMIALHVQQYGKEQTCRILSEGFSKRDSSYFPRDVQSLIDKYANDEFTRIQNALENPQQPLIILHIRNSQANKRQNIPAEFLQTNIGKLMKQRGYQVWTIYADSRLKKAGPGASAPFSIEAFVLDSRESGFISGSVDYSKQAHLQLLLKLKEIPRLIGFVGNTSGTLDVAAFIGLNVFNIHEFKEDFSFYDYRLCLQAFIFSVGEIVMKRNPQTRNKDVLELSEGSCFEEWLDNPDRDGLSDPVISTKRIESVKERKENSGFSAMFFVQTWEHNTGNNYRDLPSQRNPKGNNTGYLIALQGADGLTI